MSKKQTPADSPLIVDREGDQVVVRIGVNTLIYAAERCNRFYDDDVHYGSEGPYINIIDRDEFIHDIIRALRSEEEDGSGPLPDLFDDAAERAVDDGSEGINYDTITPEGEYGWTQ